MAQIEEDNTHVIYGPEPSIPVPQISLGIEIHRAMSEMPKTKVAMIDAFTHEQMLYQDLFQKSLNLATALRHHNYLGQSTVLSISSENCLEFFIPIFANYLNGSIMAPLNHVYTPYELDHATKICQPKVIFCSEATVQKFVDLQKQNTFIERIILLKTPKNLNDIPQGVQTMDQFIHEVLKGRNIEANLFQPINGDISKMAALIMCSSGTTGLPKGVTLSQLNVFVKLVHSRDPQYFSVNWNVDLGIMPFFHGYGQLVTFSGLLKGKTIICLNRFDEDVFLRSIQDFKIQALALAPPLALFLAKTPKLKKYDLSCIEDIICGAAPLSEETEREIKQRFNCVVRQGYGLTEATMAVAVLRKGETRHGSCGKVMTMMSAKVRDPETGKSLGPGKVGELCWKGPLIMMGYYGNPEATKDSFTSDGWLKSGDLSYYDEDGYLYVVDRLKELIKYKGFQVAPAELEAILVNHPKVRDVGVVGLPDESVGEKPLAFVVKREGADITEKELQKYVADLVSPQKRLSGGVIFVDAIPKNPSGKILRRELREWLKANLKSKL